jgi:hypothetical protein
MIIFFLLQYVRFWLCAGVAQSVSRIANDWTVNDRILQRRDFPQDRPYQHPATFPFQRVKRPGRGVDFPPQSSAEVKEIVELYFYSISAPTWSALGCNLPLKVLIISNCSRWQLSFSKSHVFEDEKIQLRIIIIIIITITFLTSQL